MESSRPVVLITGSRGRIGRAITAALADRYTVVGFELDCDDAPDCISADISSESSLSAACSTLRSSYGGTIASVIHLAAFYDFSGAPDPRYDAVNVAGTRRLIQALRGLQVEQFVYASTMLVHAPTEPGVPISEDSPLAPGWPYPKSKLAAEDVVRSERGEMSAVVLRLAGVYTDDCDVPSLANQIQRVYERQMLSRVFPGEASHGQSFTHLDDVAQAFARTVDARGRLGAETTLLIGEPNTESYEALQNLIGRLIHGESWTTRRIPKPVAAAGAWVQGVFEDVIPDVLDRGVEPFIKPFMVWLADDHYELDVSRAHELIGWQPRHSLRATLPVMIGRLRNGPAQWYRHNHIPVPLWLEGLAEQSESEQQLIAEYQTVDRREHGRTVWCHFANASLGLWLASSPFLFGLASNWMTPVTPSAPGGRGLPLSDTLMTASDVASGLLITLFALLSLSRRYAWARWIVAALGAWLLFAPLLAWTPSAAAYANDTLVGALAILFAVGIPPATGVSPTARLFGPDTPPGWDYSPSAWNQRIPIIALALVGLVISRYLAAYQLGHIPAAWDPWFGAGTERIITSSVSEAWPVSDAAVGAATYVLEIVTGVIGDKRRWRTLPWLVLLFGVLIVPLGAVSVFFIIIQPIVIGTWCTLCLVAAVAMLVQVPYSFDEIIATLQFLGQRRRKGKSLWYVLLHGDTIEGGSLDYSDNFDAPPAAVIREMVSGGVSAPWPLLACVALGAALMLTRPLFDTASAAANSDHLVGALVITFAITAMAELMRPLRFANTCGGAWLVVSPWLLSGYTEAGAAFSFASGVLLIALSLPRGSIRSHYGSWDRWARSPLPWRRTRLVT